MWMRDKAHEIQARTQWVFFHHLTLHNFCTFFIIESNCVKRSQIPGNVFVALKYFQCDVPEDKKFLQKKNKSVQNLDNSFCTNGSSL
jgi:hypothetical protein